MIILNSYVGSAPIYIETDDKDWPSWRYDGEWQNLMGMSWEYIDPPAELLKEFNQILRDKGYVFDS